MGYDGDKRRFYNKKELVKMRKIARYMEFSFAILGCIMSWYIFVYFQDSITDLYLLTKDVLCSSVSRLK